MLIGGTTCSTSRKDSICATRMAESTVARHSASFPLVSFSVAMCANGDEGKEFAEELAMDEFEVGFDYHERRKGLSVCTSAGTRAC